MTEPKSNRNEWTAEDWDQWQRENSRGSYEGAYEEVPETGVTREGIAAKAGVTPDALKRAEEQQAEEERLAAEREEEQSEGYSL